MSKDDIAAQGPLDRNVRRHRAPSVGDWYAIRKNRDNGGCPLIRVERVEDGGKVFVTDWLSFGEQYIAPPTPSGYQIPAERQFACHYATWDQRMKAWKKVTPNCASERPAGGRSARLES